MALSSLHRCAYLNINGSSQNKTQTFNVLFIKKCDEKNWFITYSFSFLNAKQYFALVTVTSFHFWKIHRNFLVLLYNGSVESYFVNINYTAFIWS